ncbi:PAS domain S-box protein [Haloarculaceae archaeon H-GB11]|nr:PAS domain S-box protein [Haloarculaceae archaeon H-GB11]
MARAGRTVVVVGLAESDVTRLDAALPPDFSLVAFEGRPPADALTGATVVVVDATLDDGRDLVASLRRGDGPPSIVLSDDRPTALLDAGATDYARRDEDRLLATRVEHAAAHRRETRRPAGTEQNGELDRYRRLVETAGDGMYVLDADGYYTVVNEALTEYVGLDRADLVGTHPRDFMTAEDYRRGTELVLDLIDDDERWWDTFEYDVAFDDGRVRSFENNVAPLTDSNGEFAGSVGVVRDITERTKRERELERYRMLVEAVGDPMYVLDEEGRYVMVNDAMVEYTGYAREEFIGAHPLKFMSEESFRRGTDLVMSVLEDDDRKWATFEFDDGVALADSSRAVENNVAPLTDSDGEYAGSVGVIRDVTDRNRREMALERQNERLDEFASVVSHDLRNPLSVLTSRLELARETDDPTHFDAMEDSIRDMTELIDQLLLLAREGRSLTTPNRSPSNASSN